MSRWPWELILVCLAQGLAARFLLRPRRGLDSETSVLYHPIPTDEGKDR